MTLTRVVRGGTVYDGSGGPGARVDIGIEGDRVVLVGTDLPDAPGAEVIDATGFQVTPGFINVLSHAWASLQLDGSGASDLLQGVTTEVFGEAFSLGPSDERFVELVKSFGEVSNAQLVFDHLREGLDHVVSCRIAPNIASFVGGTNLRILGAGFDDRPLTAVELDRLRGLLDEEMADGALGVGTALIYPPGRFASTDELVALCEVVGKHDGTYISHLRSEGDQFLECLDELLEIGRRAECRTEVYHLKAAGRHNWPKMAQAIERLQSARDGGQRVTANMYPYIAGGTALAAAIPPRFHDGGPAALEARLNDPVQRKAAVAEMHELSGDFENLYLAGGPENILFPTDLEDGTAAAGKRLSELAADLGHTDPAEALIDIVLRASGTGVLYFMMSEDNVELGLSQPWVSIGSDAEATPATQPFTDKGTHPRAYGTFARFLGHYSRNRGLVPLEDAVRRMTSLPAETLGLRHRGSLAPGSYADVVVLDAATVIDHATFERPHQYAGGVRHVLVNGEVVVRDGAMTAARPGRRVARQR